MRLFVAICLTEACKDALCAASAQLRQHALRGNFSRRENLHLTLAFLGETARLDAAKRALGAVQAEPFSLRLAGLGRFRRGSGDLWWMGVSESGALTALQRQVYEALAAEGFSLEKRAFHPHLTLGREIILENGFDPTRAIRIPPMGMQVAQISLMESRRISGVLQYIPRAAQPLNAGGGA